RGSSLHIDGAGSRSSVLSSGVMQTGRHDAPTEAGADPGLSLEEPPPPRRRSTGIGGRNHRNGWPASAGISGRDGPESVAGFGRNTQYIADRLDSVLLTVLVDERHHHFARRSSSACAKYADALRRISLARRSSRFSRSSSLSRSRSWLVRPGRCPAS